MSVIQVGVFIGVWAYKRKMFIKTFIGAVDESKT